MTKGHTNSPAVGRRAVIAGAAAGLGVRNLDEDRLDVRHLVRPQHAQRPDVAGHDVPALDHCAGGKPSANK